MTQLIVLGLIVAAVYAIQCLIWPFAACRSCGGTGKHRSPSGKAFRSCGACEGKGRRLRLGRKLFGGR
ncbi:MULTISPECIES: hypothetical protein [Amycolatopsis]|uniref:Uncharacterized protein n=1 Tax=Amycolatopsis dongchuanensis TaxID=1070866 RepID=A0ABP9Q325_9PSEU